MKTLLCSMICLASLHSFAQLDEPVSLVATGHLHFKAKGSSLNDAGYGLNVDAAVFSTHKLQLLVETSADWFVGDKLLKADPQGRENKVAVMYSVKAGARLFVMPRLALAATIGPA